MRTLHSTYHCRTPFTTNHTLHASSQQITSYTPLLNKQQATRPFSTNNKLHAPSQQTTSYTPLLNKQKATHPFSTNNKLHTPSQQTTSYTPLLNKQQATHPFSTNNKLHAPSQQTTSYTHLLCKHRSVSLRVRSELAGVEAFAVNMLKIVLLADDCTVHLPHVTRLHNLGQLTGGNILVWQFLKHILSTLWRRYVVQYIGGMQCTIKP